MTGPEGADSDDHTRPAAYGFRIEGLEPTPALALRGVGAWPTLLVEPRVDAKDADPGPEGAVVRSDWASIRTPAGRLVVDRARGRVTIHSSARVNEAEVVHPGLWPAAAVCARWRGAETLHAGLFIPAAGGGAWAVMSARGGGKSSLLASLALAGHEVLVDDLVVVEGRECYAGPRCIDLRPEAAAELELGSGDVTPVRATARRRLQLAPAPGGAELQGFVHLVWGEATAIDRLAPSEVFAVLAHHRRVSVLGTDFAHLLELAALPMLRLSRPAFWNHLAHSRGMVLAAIAEASV